MPENKFEFSNKMKGTLSGHSLPDCGFRRGEFIMQSFEEFRPLRHRVKKEFKERIANFCADLMGCSPKWFLIVSEIKPHGKTSKFRKKKMQVSGKR